MDTTNYNVPWCAIVAADEARVLSRLLSLSAAEWKEEGCRRLRTFRGREIRDCVSDLEEVDRLRAAHAERLASGPPTRPAARRRASPFARDFAFWRDVVEEPYKYGDDTLMRWLALDAKLLAGRGRWRIGAYWAAKDQEVEDRRRAEDQAVREAEREEAERAEAELAEAQAPFRSVYSRCAKEAAWRGERAWVHRDFARHIAAYHRKVARAKQAALLDLPPTGCPGYGDVRCAPGTLVPRGAVLCMGCASWKELDTEGPLPPCPRRVRAATRIAAAVRGHHTRTRLRVGDCCMCLSHRICPLITGAGPMCRGCAALGPYEDETGPLPDEWNWYRSDYAALSLSP